MKKTAVSLLAIALSTTLFAQTKDVSTKTVTSTSAPVTEATAQPVQAQTTPTLHLKGFELFGTASVGMFGLNYSPANGSHVNGPGLRVGIGGGFFINPTWGLTTGLNIATYTAFSSIAAGTSYAYTAYDSDGLPYTEKIHVDNKISESNIVYQLEFPLMLNYRHYLPSGNAWYVAGGMKMSLPIGGHYRVSKGAVTTTGKYEDQNVTLSNLPWLNFTTTDLAKSTGMISLKKSYIASFEVGYLLKQKKTTFLTFSAFGDYGLNNLRHDMGAANLVYPSLQYVGIPCSNTVNFVRLMSFGVKASWHINISGEPTVKGKRKTYEQPTKSTEPPPADNRTKSGRQRMGR
jgi:hypothetical protein